MWKLQYFREQGNIYVYIISEEIAPPYKNNLWIEWKPKDVQDSEKLTGFED